MQWTCKIDNFHPVKTNELIGKNRFVAQRLKQASMDIMIAEFIKAGIPKATGKRRVHLLITLGPRQRGGDVDSWHKGLLDSAVHAGMLIDDRKEWCELAPVSYDRGKIKATTITFEEIPS